MAAASLASCLRSAIRGRHHSIAVAICRLAPPRSSPSGDSRAIRSIWRSCLATWLTAVTKPCRRIKTLLVEHVISDPVMICEPSLPAKSTLRCLIAMPRSPRHLVRGEQSGAIALDGGRNGAPNLARAGRNYGRDRSWKVVWTGFCRSSGEKFLEFFPVHFGKIYKIAHRSRPPRSSPTSATICCMKCPSSDSSIGLKAASIGSRPSTRRRSSRNCRWAAFATCREARFQFFRTLLFPKCSLSLSHVKRSAAQLNERLVEIGDAAKNPGNSSVRRVVRLRSDPSQTIDVADRMARDSRPLGATSTCAAIAAARVAASMGLSASFGTARTDDFRSRAPSRAAERRARRRNDDFVVLNIVQIARERLRVRQFNRSAKHTSAIRQRAKFFFAMQFFWRKRVAQIQQFCTTTSKWNLNRFGFTCIDRLKECLIRCANRTLTYRKVTSDR